jgi:hypothetical protein
MSPTPGTDPGTKTASQIVLNRYYSRAGRPKCYSEGYWPLGALNTSQCGYPQNAYDPVVQEMESELRTNRLQLVLEGPVQLIETRLGVLLLVQVVGDPYLSSMRVKYRRLSLHCVVEAPFRILRHMTHLIVQNLSRDVAIQFLLQAFQRESCLTH